MSTTLTKVQELKNKFNIISLNAKLAKLPDVDLSLDKDDDDEEENKLEELTKNLLSRKLKVGSDANPYRFASMESQSDEFVSYFLIKGDTTNGRDWGVTNESIPKNIHTFKGMPFVITSNEFIPDSIYGEVYDHPNVRDAPKIGLAREGAVNVNDVGLVKAFQDAFRVGTIEDVIKVKDTWRAIIKKDKQFVGKQFPPFCSPAIFRGNDTDPEDAIAEWDGLHLAGLDERPAYGNIAIYKGSCSGDLATCKDQFRVASSRTVSFPIRPATNETLYAYVGGKKVKLASSEPCKVMQLKKAMAVHNIRSAVLMSPTNRQTQVQTIFKKKQCTKKDDKLCRDKT